jgi:hypothetical protein
MQNDEEELQDEIGEEEEPTPKEISLDMAQDRWLEWLRRQPGDAFPKTREQLEASIEPLTEVERYQNPHFVINFLKECKFLQVQTGDELEFNMNRIRNYQEILKVHLHTYLTEYPQ